MAIGTVSRFSSASGTGPSHSAAVAAAMGVGVVQVAVWTFMMGMGVAEEAARVEGGGLVPGSGGGVDLEATLGIHPSSAVGREDLRGAGVGTVVLDRRGRGARGGSRPRHRCIP